MNNQTSITNSTDISTAIDALVWAARAELIALSAESKRECNRLMVFAKPQMARAKHFIKAIKPAAIQATVSPSIAPSPIAEHAIALTAITSTPLAKMELETYTLNLGGAIYRITEHNPRLFSIEKRIEGQWEYVLNCTLPEQVDRLFANWTRPVSTPVTPAQPTTSSVPVMAPVDTPIPAPVETLYRCHTLYAEAYHDGAGFLWRLKIRGPMQGGLVMSGYIDSAAAIKMGQTYIDDKYRQQARRGKAGL